MTVAAGDDTKVSAFATVSTDGLMSLTFLNRSHGADGVEMDVEASLPASCSAKDVKVLFLVAPKGDIAAKTGLTLGGAPILSDGRWNGRWTPLKGMRKNGKITVSVPAASAVVVRVSGCTVLRTKLFRIRLFAF